MEKCKFCGRELGEDGRCTCADFQDNEKINSCAPAADAELVKEKPIKRGGILKYLAVLLIVLAVIAIAVMVMLGMGAYKKPIKTLTKGLSKANTELIIESMYTETTKAEISLRARNQGLEWKDYLKHNDKAVESSMKGKGIKKIKAKVIAKEKLSGSNLDNVKEHYDRKYGVTVRKAYRVEVEFTLKVNGEKVVKDGWLCVAKLKGSGWKYCPEYSESSFDFLTTAINFE